MTPEFYEEYDNATSNANLRQSLYFNNPNKFMACDYLVKLHEARGDKIIIFCDQIFALK